MNISKNRYISFKLIICFLLILTLIIVVFLKSTKKQESPNLVLISIDTLRSDHVGAYGYPKNTTPNIDNIAKSGLLFKNLRTSIPMTYPSFASLMTGKDPIKTRVTRNRGILVSENNKTLASILKENGYETGAFFTGALNPRSTNLNQGVDDEDYMFFKNYYFNDDQEKYYQTSRENYEEFIDDSLGWLEKNRNQKFFYWIHLMDPHAPYEPPEDLKCKFDHQYCPQILGKSAEELEIDRMEYQNCQNQSVPAGDIGKQMTLYDGGVAYSDRLLGIIYKRMQDLDLDKNTIVMIYSDHGEGFDHNYYFNHRAVLYESALRVPLIIKLPNSNLNKTIDADIQNKDVLPMLLKLLNIPYNPSKFDGQNVLNESNNLFRFLKKDRLLYFYNSDFTKFAVFDGRFKYIYSTPQTCLFHQQTEELYDLKSDPQELENLESVNTKKAQYLKEQLLNYLSEYNLPPATRSRFTNLESTSSAQYYENQDPASIKTKDISRPLPY